MPKGNRKTNTEAIDLVKRLGKMPANILTPSQMVVEAKNLHKNIKVTDLNEEALEKLGANLLLSVGQGSLEETHMIVMEYNGGNKGDKPIVLVGKGVTFDTGGVSIKPSNKMHQMKMDMLGAGTVMAVIQAGAKRK